MKKNELILSVETSDDEWFEIFSYEETETDLKDISELIIFKTNTDFYSNFHYNSSNETEDLNFVDYKLKKVLDTIPTKEEIENYFGKHSFDDVPYGFVYMVKNKKSGRCYIGQTTSGISIFNGGALKRYSQGWLNEHNHKYNVQEDLNLYGAYSFSDLKIISLAYSKDELDMLEAYWMKKTNSLIDGYNIALPHFINIKSKK